jgi:hypothetical protein
MVSDLTTDLDRISEELFKLATNGGSEYCGMVIDKAVDRLAWSRSSDVLKVIYIAGNEPFTQGPVAYRASAAKAIRHGIIVNTVFCGTRQEGIATFWKDGADRADGRYMSIDSDEAVAQVDTPFDAEIVTLGDALNKTYLGYGVAGKALKERQVAQDANAASMGQGATVQRSVAKAQSVYSNESWDLVDGLRDKSVALQDLKEDQLPAEMRKMTPAQREEYVRTMAAQRAEIQKKINIMNEKRRVYVAAEMKKRAGSNTLDQAILGSVTAQAEAKGFTIE